jgi:hypothetical protein
MIGKTVIQTLTTAVIVAVSAGISLIAAAFGLFVVLREQWGEAVASATIAGLFSLLALMVALVASRTPTPVAKPVQPTPEASPLLTSLIALMRDRPLISAAVATVASFIAVRNPQIVSSLIKTFFSEKDPQA